MSSKLSVAGPLAKLSSVSRGKRCSVQHSCSGSEDNVYDYEGPEFIIHKEDFLIHGKKVSNRNLLLLPVTIQLHMHRSSFSHLLLLRHPPFLASGAAGPKYQLTYLQITYFPLHALGHMSRAPICKVIFLMYLT